MGQVFTDLNTNRRTIQVWSFDGFPTDIECNRQITVVSCSEEVESGVNTELCKRRVMNPAWAKEVTVVANKTLCIIDGLLSLGLLLQKCMQNENSL